MKKTEMFQVVNSFEDDIISEERLQCALKEYVSNYDCKNYRYYLSDLYKENLIYKYKKGIYKLCNNRKEFIFEKNIPDIVVETLKKINPKIVVSIWSLSDISKFMSLQMFTNIHFIETYSYSEEVVLNTLIDQNLNVIYEKDYLSISKYIKSSELYVVRTINEDSPINKSKSNTSRLGALSFITSPKIEKVLVDIIISKFFDMLLGDEINTIVKSILMKYKINISTCLRYANKKYRTFALDNYLESINFNIQRGEFE